MEANITSRAGTFFYEQMAESGMLGGLGKIISTGKSGMKNI
jgi:hypothetical protein